MTNDPPERSPRRPAAANTADRTSRPRSTRYEEWMLDEAVEETFPASDPPATSYPGSSLWEMAQQDRAHRARLLAGLSIGALLVVAGLLVMDRGPRDRAGV